MKKLYIEEHDERNKMIRDKIDGVGFFFSVAMIGAGTVIAGFLDKTIFFTLFAVTVFMVLVLASLKTYYKTKY